MTTGTRNTHCTIPGCLNGHEAKGLCKKHYQRMCKNGSTDPKGTPKGDVPKYIAEVVLSHSGDECLLWPFSIRNDGYGGFTKDGKTYTAHRFICRAAHGEPPTNTHHAAHYCGNRRCVNPSHLRWATRAENYADSVGHGTASVGDRHPATKISDADIPLIVSLKGTEKACETAARFGVVPSTISMIQNRRQRLLHQEVTRNA